MTIKNDKWIRKLSLGGMIDPFESTLIRQIDRHKKLSFGTGSYGYDLRLSPKDFKIFRHIPGTVVDPKRFNPKNLEAVPLHQDNDDTYFVLPARSYGLGVSLERVTMPPNVTAICLGKSTYARVGVIANITPIEAGWAGHITLEFSNSSSADCRIYAGEGVVQLLFFEGDPCDISYSDRKGKYQDQAEMITFARV